MARARYDAVQHHQPHRVILDRILDEIRVCSNARQMTELGAEHIPPVVIAKLRPRISATMSYSSARPHSVRSPVINTTSGVGRNAETARNARSVVMFVSDTLLQAIPNGRTWRSVSWQISTARSLFGGLSEAVKLRWIFHEDALARGRLRHPVEELRE
jgi:hypothetical protein